MTAEDAITWVDQNTKQIAGHSRKYLPYAPYDQEDFLQDAYEAALEAATVSTERQTFFPACFWNLYKGKISAVTPNPDSRCKAGSSAPPQVFCDSFEYSLQQFSQEDSTCHVEPLFNIDIDHVYPFIRQYLTKKEEQILETLLGIYDGGTMKIKETARHLECSSANVRQALNRACRRISLLVASGELSAEFVETKIMKQFEVILESGNPEVNRTAKLDMRCDVPCRGDLQQEQPKRHQAQTKRRKSDSQRSMGTKKLQSPDHNKVAASEILQGSSFGRISAPRSGLGLSMLGTITNWKVFGDYQPIGGADTYSDFCLDDMADFALRNNFISERSMKLFSQRQSRKVPVDNVITLLDCKMPYVPDSGQRNNLNISINIFLDKYGGASLVTQDRSPPVRVAKRERNIERIGRNRPISIFNNPVSVGHSARLIPLSMVA